MRRLGPGDEDLLTQLALSGSRYEEAGVAEPDEVPLPPADAANFLADDRTHLFVAYEDGADDLLGFVVANELLHRHTFTRMLIVYEIGVDDASLFKGPPSPKR